MYGNNLMFVFGGIFDVTKELNDLMAFDFVKKQWVTLFEELGPANQSPTRAITSIDTSSPMLKMSNVKKDRNNANDLLRP